MPIQQLQPEYVRPIYQGTWAGKPAAAGNAGKEIIVTDFNRSRWYSDGTYWLPVGGFGAKIAYSDDFKRPDTALGSIGGGWTLTGNGVAQTRLTGMKYLLPQTDPVNVRTVYASRVMPTGFNPTYCKVGFNWKSNGGASGIKKTIAIIMNSTETLGNVLGSVHVTLQNYVATQVLTAGSAFIDVAPNATASPAQISTDGSTHVLEVFIYGTLLVTMLDGVLMGYADSPTYMVPVLPIRQLIVEHYSASGDDIQYELEINEVHAGYAV